MNKTKLDRIHQTAILLLIIAAVILNFLGAFGPELGFDALWYHLPIAKIYLESGQIFHIPGGLLYYSAMPRLSEIMFIPLLKTFSFVGPHFLSFFAGVGTAILTYFLARRWLTKTNSLLTVLIFYITPLVGWLSGSAYVDLIRTFWETLALWLILGKKFSLSGLVLGIAISTKTLSLGSVPIDLILIYLISGNFFQAFKTAIIIFLVGIPWYALSFLNTGFPFYPIGAGVLDSRHSALPQILSPLSILADYWKVFMTPEDFINPIFVLIVPFAIFKLRALWTKHRILVIYFILSYAVWWIIPRLGGGRFLLPFLPMWSILAVIVISLQNNLTKKILIFSLVVIATFNTVYRMGAEFKLRNYLLGRESEEKFLCNNLDFNLGVFVDCDGFFAKTIKPTDMVLVKGVHNLFYVDFPFIHESWYRGEKVGYTLIQGNQKSQKNDGKLIYQNDLTKVKLYKLD